MSDSKFHRNKIPVRTLLVGIIFIGLIILDYYAISSTSSFGGSDFRNSIIIGSTTGIITSLVFSLILLLLKPSIRISDNIAKFDGKYVLKMTNNSWFFDLLDVHVSLIYEEHFHVDNGINVRTTEVKLKRNEFMYIPGRFWERDTAGFAQLFMTEERLEERIAENSNMYVLQVYARHSFSNFCKIKRKKYLTPDCIKDGKFKRGDNFGIFEPNTVTEEEKNFFEPKAQ